MVFLADGRRYRAATNKGRTEMAEHPSWRRSRSGCRDRTGAGRRQTATASKTRPWGMGREARRRPSTSGASASVSPVSTSDQDHIQLDREWTLVHQKGKTDSKATRLPDRHLWRRETGALAAKTSEEEPQAFGNGREETASAAPGKQEAVLFNRILRRFVSRQRILGTTGCAEVSA